MWILWTILCLVIFAINFMILSKLMDVDGNDPADVAFCCFFSAIGSVFIIPISLIFPVMKKLATYGVMPVFKGLFWLRDIIHDGAEDFIGNVTNHIGRASAERKIIRENNKAVRKEEKAEKKNAIIRALKKDIKELNARIKELNKYDREEIIEI